MATAVRFATATNIVKKQLGIEDYEEGFKSDAQRKAAFASGYKEKGKNKKEELDDKDKETIKPIIKQLQKSVKAHGKQAKQLQKDIKDEVELDEVHFSNRGEPPAPKGMHKLRSGRDIPSTLKLIKYIRRLLQ